MNDPATLTNSENLGDRDLAAWVGAADGGTYTFATYSYTNLVGAGNANVFKSVKYGSDHTTWHFIYFGYTRKDRRAYGYV